MYSCVWYFCIYLYGLSLYGWHAVFCITNYRHDITITTHAIKHHFLIWMTTVRPPTKRRCPCVLTLKYTFICVYWWTRQRINNTLIAVDRYLRLMGDKTIPDSAEPRLELFYPPFVADIDLPHQGVVDSYNLPSSRASHGRSIVRIWEKIDRAITALCIWSSTKIKWLSIELITVNQQLPGNLHLWSKPFRLSKYLWNNFKWNIQNMI